MVLSYSGCLCRVGFDRRVARAEGQNTKPLFLIQKKEIRKQEVGTSVAFFTPNAAGRHDSGKA